jgi:hypothetical protein
MTSTKETEYALPKLYCTILPSLAKTGLGGGGVGIRDRNAGLSFRPYQHAVFDR